MNKPVLDACCGSRMFWFDKQDDRVAFMDIRSERHILKDKSSKGGNRELIVEPDIVADFTAMPFQDESFALVVFDPPHFQRNGVNGWMAKKYGVLSSDWRETIKAGFSECFRVLRPQGTLIFKWNADEIPVSKILELTDQKPLFGHKSGKQQKTHWIAFLKPNVTHFCPKCDRIGGRYRTDNSGQKSCVHCCCPLSQRRPYFVERDPRIMKTQETKNRPMKKSVSSPATEKSEDLESSLKKFNAEHEEIHLALEAMYRSQIVQRQRLDPILKKFFDTE